jgi:hypothetical protein
MNVYQLFFGLDITFIRHFNIQLVITLNYSSSANFHTLQNARAHAKFFQSAVSLLVLIW